MNQRQLKFVSLLAVAESEGLSVVECYRRAGYNNDPANANKAARKLAEFVEAERAKLGISQPTDANPDPIDDADKAELIADLRRVYALSIEREETGPAAKALRGIERLLKKPGRPGRPTADKPATAKPKQTERMSHAEFTALVDLFLELPEIEEEAEPGHV